jgi:uncharacterized membrane protein YeaQ/YmgE (transglycosylase-associated protein family)
MLGLVFFIFTGLIVGTIAKALVPGREPGAGITILLGTVAQIAAWFGSRLVGWDRHGQPWSFFLSIAAAAALLYAYREAGLDEVLARPQAVPIVPDPIRVSHPPREPLWSRMIYAPGWMIAGAFMLGTTGFIVGFFGPMRFHPGANQGPMLGIFITGPAGALLGMMLGAWLRIGRPEWPMRWRLWTLNTANVAYGLVVLYAVMQPTL